MITLAEDNLVGVQPTVPTLAPTAKAPRPVPNYNVVPVLNNDTHFVFVLRVQTEKPVSKERKEELQAMIADRAERIQGVCFVEVL